MITEILIFIFVFFTSFLIHEISHIKSQGLKTTGKIFVEKYGLTCVSDKIMDFQWFRLAGGLLTSVIMFIMMFCSSGFWQWSFLTVGIIHLIYGFYEGYTNKNVQLERYMIYIFITIVMMAIWLTIK